LGINQFECGTYVDVRAAPRELCGERSKICSVLAVKGIDAQTMLLDVMVAAEADAKDVVWLLAHAGVGG
jgi:hypothetical protein